MHIKKIAELGLSPGVAVIATHTFKWVIKFEVKVMPADIFAEHTVGIPI